ncbi:MAG: 3-keto-disaccharide hydrolase [Aureliella sp.]
MIRHITLAMLLTVCALPTACRLVAEDNVPPEGFTALFNGKDLSGWHGSVRVDRLLKGPQDAVAKEQAEADKLMEEHWKVDNGVLINDGRGTNLATIKHYKDFELLVDWKINPKGDSGIYLRGIPQVQIWDSKSLNDKQYPREKNKGSGALWNNKNPEDKIPLTFADKEPGQWNTFHITMKGDRVTVKLNGELVADNVRLDNLWEPGQPVPERGPVELQYHPNQEGKPDNLYFKNVYIRELR